MFYCVTFDTKLYDGNNDYKSEGERKKGGLGVIEGIKININLIKYGGQLDLLR
jgi:hypothetical protein